MKAFFVNPLRKPSARKVAQEELETSQRELVKYEAAAIYHTKMAEYHRDNIAQLARHTEARHGG
jgi:hypothetical protein